MFRKLADMLPEAIEIVLAGQDRADAELAAARAQTIQTRSNAVHKLEQIIREDSLPGTLQIPRMSEWEISFVRSILYRAQTYDTNGVFGGRLADLTEKQVSTLGRLAVRVLGDASVLGQDSQESAREPCEMRFHAQRDRAQTESH